MVKRFIVVDQNMLRKQLLETLLFDHADLQIVLPDLAFLEMTKSAEWESTLRNSLAILAKYPRRLHVCLSVNEVLGLELRALRPISTRIIFPEASKFMREVLRGFHVDMGSTSLDRLRQEIGEHVDELTQQHLDHDVNKAGLFNLIETTSDMLDAETEHRLRAGKLTGEQLVLLIQSLAERVIPGILKEQGMEQASLARFIGRRPMVLRYVYLKVWRCVRWLALGGFQDRTPAAVTNDLMDDQYILSATYFHGLLSLENSVNEAYRSLQSILATVQLPQRPGTRSQVGER